MALASAGAGCGANPAAQDFSIYRAAIAKDLLDPASAQFRNERVRTLWTKSGKRRTIYCVEVNAKNALGGYTGFGGGELVISNAKLRADTVFKPGTAWPKFGPMEFYLDCQRTDTERSDRGIEWVTAEISPILTAENRAWVDASFPVISSNEAPD